MSIRRYVLVNKDDEEGDYEYTELDEAKRDAARLGCAVIARVYAYDDSELMWTPTGENVWPPKKEKD